MTPSQPFVLVYSPLVREHLLAIVAKDRLLFRAAIEEQLLFEPGVETRNRKPLKRVAAFEAEMATWEIRFGPDNCFRVFYEVDQAQHVVRILALGEKKGSRLFVGGKEVKL
jgi:mRNA-degrading endonuclease RelE of RelBE toxin-antitoxin system